MQISAINTITAIKPLINNSWLMVFLLLGGACLTRAHFLSVMMITFCRAGYAKRGALFVAPKPA